MGTMRRLAVTLGIALTGWALTPPAGAEPGPNDDKGKDQAAAGKPDKAALEAKLKARREARRRFREKRSRASGKSLGNRQERMERAAKKLRERAESLRKEAESTSDEKQSQRLAARADKFEAQATRMEERAKTLGQEPDAPRQRKARAERGPNRLRDVRRAQLRRRWGHVLEKEEAIAELKVHARRTARLNQIRKVARRAKNKAAAQRASKLIALERKRHEARMKAIQATLPKAAKPGADDRPAVPTNAATETKEKSQ